MAQVEREFTKSPSMPVSAYDVIVVGAGPGGSSCAALLAKRGVKVLLIEKTDRAGGKCMSVSKHGFTYELWQVAGIPKFNSRFDELLHELGLESEMCHPEKPVTRYHRTQSGEYRPFDIKPGEEQNPETFSRLIEWLGLGEGDNLEEIARYNSDLASLTPEEIDALDDITYHEFLSRYQWRL